MSFLTIRASFYRINQQTKVGETITIKNEDLSIEVLNLAPELMNQFGFIPLFTNIKTGQLLKPSIALAEMKGKSIVNHEQPPSPPSPPSNTPITLFL